MKLIDADALIEKFRLDTDYSRYTAIWADSLKEWIKEQPDMNLYFAPLFHAKWYIDDYGFTRCSNCEEPPNDGAESEYCPNCGAKMDEDDL